MQFGELVQMITRQIEDQGAMSALDIARAINHPPKTVSACISRLCRAGAKSPQRLYVAGWVYDTDKGGDPRYPRATYALGSQPGAPKPRTDRKAIANRYRQRTKTMCNSVFNWAQPGRSRRPLAST